MIELSDVAKFFLQLEGPYRWYVIGSILVVLTAIITRFIFKTIKWFLVIALAVIVGLTIVHYFTSIDLLTLLENI
jgi:uncharacterized membrane protein YdbT with pleckstrin-like domain